MIDSCASLRRRDALTFAACDVGRLNEECQAPGWSGWYLVHARATQHLLAAPQMVVELVRPGGLPARWQWGDKRTGQRQQAASLDAARLAGEAAIMAIGDAE